MTRGSAAGPDGKQIGSRYSRLHGLQLTGIARAHAGDFPAALAALREAAALEGKSPRPPGPPVEKPAHELLGEVLLRAGDSNAAMTQFKIALERHPNRALSLLGLARAEAAAGQKAAARLTYGKLMDIWREADAGLPELLEAREYTARSQALASRG